MATHHTLIGGTAYKITGGSVLIAGTKYQIGGGTTEVAGTKMSIPLSSGILLADTTPGEILMLNEGGSLAPFYIAKHDYESGLNGAGRTLLVRKDCYDMHKWAQYTSNAYASSEIDSWLNSTYKNLLDTDIRGAIGTTKFRYTPGLGNNTVGTLERDIFLLSVTELGKTASYANTEGSALDIASSLQIAYMNGTAVVQWTRSPKTGTVDYTCYLRQNGNVGNYLSGNPYGSRPAFTLPGTLGVEQNADGTYSIA